MRQRNLPVMIKPERFRALHWINRSVQQVSFYTLLRFAVIANIGWILVVLFFE
jgi:hypothetical protein